MRPRTDPLEPDDDERLLEAADFAAPEARPAEDDARLVPDDDARLVADDERLVADDVRLVAAEPPLRSVDPRLPEDFALEERLDVERLEPEEPEEPEDRVRLLLPLLVAISMHLLVAWEVATPGSETDNWCICRSDPRNDGCVPT